MLLEAVQPSRGIVPCSCPNITAGPPGAHTAGALPLDQLQRIPGFVEQLGVLHYNFVKIHSTLRTTPAQAAGVTDRLWEIEDLVALLED